MTNLADYIAKQESPSGEDNFMGSGAFSRFQFMPATAVELARKTPWGAGATPANIKELVLSTPGRDRELFDLYSNRSKGALAGTGFQPTNANMLALHRFGQGGGLSLLRAPANMKVADWVNSVNWGSGVAPSEVIRQNRLEQYADVGDLRRRFIGAAGGEAPATPVAADPTPQPQLASPAPQAASVDPLTVASLADLFAPPPERRRQEARRTWTVLG